MLRFCLLYKLFGIRYLRLEDFGVIPYWNNEKIIMLVILPQIPHKHKKQKFYTFSGNACAVMDIKAKN